MDPNEPADADELTFELDVEPSPAELFPGQVWTLSASDGNQRMSCLLDVQDNSLLFVPVSLNFQRMDRDAGDELLRGDHDDSPLPYDCFLETWCLFEVDPDGLRNYFGALSSDQIPELDGPADYRTGIDERDRYRRNRLQTFNEQFGTRRSTPQTHTSEELTDDVLDQVAGGLDNPEEWNENGT